MKRAHVARETVSRAAIAIVLAIGLASSGAFAQPVSKPPAQEDRSTSAMWRPRRHIDLHWQLLMLPERVVSLVFLPLELLIGAIEEYRLDRRLNDLLTLHDGRITLSPRFKFSFGDGLGAGVWVKRSQLAGGNAEMKVGGLARLNLDWQVEVEYDHRLLLPGGRGLRASAYLENDQNQRYYGIGGQTLEADRRVLASFDQGALAEIDLQGIDRYTFSGIAQLGFRRQALSPGVAPGDTPITAGDTVTPPPGFDATATFIDVLVAGRYDSRDTAGRPTRGVFLEAAALGRKEVTGQPLSAVTLSGTARIHVPLLRDNRVLVLSLWGSAAMALSGDEIPLDALPVIGRKNVRGYDRERFRDRYALVGSAEYRFPIYEYLSSGAGLDAFGFFDAGTLWGTAAFSPDPLRYSFGGGLRGAHETRLVFEATLGWSPEGLQINLGVEKAL